MKSLFLMFVFVGIVFGCQSDLENKAYRIINKEGVYVEKFDSLYVSPNRYTENNRTYRGGSKLSYDYYYEDKKGIRYKYENTEGGIELDIQAGVKTWYFVREEDATEKTIDKVVLTVKEGMANNPNSTQTEIEYAYLHKNGQQDYPTTTGLVENEKNIWLHPPRDKFFRILEINPFPFIQAPYEIGHTWNWSLSIGSYWGDERWKNWEGRIENTYTYEITGKESIETLAGSFECFEIKSTATSKIGKSYLTAYFNEEVGFVKLEYINIDKTKTMLELVGVEKHGEDES